MARRLTGGVRRYVVPMDGTPQMDLTRYVLNLMDVPDIVSSSLQLLSPESTRTLKVPVLGPSSVERLRLRQEKPQWCIQERR